MSLASVIVDRHPHPALYLFFCINHCAGRHVQRSQTAEESMHEGMSESRCALCIGMMKFPHWKMGVHKSAPIFLVLYKI